MDRQSDDRPPVVEGDDRVEGQYPVVQAYEATLPPDTRREVQDAAYHREMADAGTAGIFTGQPQFPRAHTPPPQNPRMEMRVLPAEPWSWQARRSRHWRKP